MGVAIEQRAMNRFEFCTEPNKKSSNFFGAPVFAVILMDTVQPPAQGHYCVLAPPVNYPKEGERPVRVYASGIYDLFHHGHGRFLKQAKELFPNTFLIVGVVGDEETARAKGRTLMSETERAEQVLHCRYVDQVVVRGPYSVTAEFLDSLDIDFAVHGDDDAFDENGNDAYASVKAVDKYRTVRRTDGISTTDLIVRVLRDYNDYVERSVKRGITPQELNISASVWVRFVR